MAERRYRGYSLNIRSEIALAGILPDVVRLSPVKLQPFPGEDRRNAAERERLLSLLRQWGNNVRIRDFLDLEFMAETIRSTADPAALEDGPADEAPVDEAGQ